MFSDALLAREVAFRGGTALHKLHFNPPGRYSEDIDLVQVNAGPFGPVMDAVRARLDPWLGEPQWKQGQGGEAPLGYVEPGDEVVVEYDEDVLREIEERDELA